MEVLVVYSVLNSLWNSLPQDVMVMTVRMTDCLAGGKRRFNKFRKRIWKVHFQKQYVSEYHLLEGNETVAQMASYPILGPSWKPRSIWLLRVETVCWTKWFDATQLFFHSYLSINGSHEPFGDRNI